MRKDGTTSVQREGLLIEKLGRPRELDLPVFEHGRRREPVIARWISENFDITPNDTLFVGENWRHMATPDGFGSDGPAEIKTSVKPWAKIARHYSDQIQWQMYVVAASRSLLVVEHRDNPGHLQYGWVQRDDERIATLVKHANLFLDELAERRQRR